MTDKLTVGRAERAALAEGRYWSALGCFGHPPVMKWESGGSGFSHFLKLLVGK